MLFFFKNIRLISVKLKFAPNTSALAINVRLLYWQLLKAGNRNDKPVTNNGTRSIQGIFIQPPDNAI
jgi:hypothetical protein